MTLQPPPLSLYVHLPWCVRKCPYCDFNSHAAPAQLPQTQYVDALLDDLLNDLPWAAGRSLTSVFFGGGTPSLFDPVQIGRLLEGVARHLPLAPDAELTLEANPGTIEHGRFADYRAAGINRVSLGAQSFNDAQLQKLGRIHGSGDIERAAQELQLAGIDNFNLDLMYGLPGQRLSEALADLEAALALRPAHISHYQLTLEPGTVFYHRPPPLPPADDLWQMQEESQQLLAAHGFDQYEVSAYARAGRRSRHNLNYWRFGDYLGIGAGAHGKLTTTGPDACVMRTARVRQPRQYLAAQGADRLAEQRQVPTEDLTFEFMLNALRLVDGFEQAQFEAYTGLPLAGLDPVLTQARQRNLMESPRPGAWRATADGQRLLNDLQAMFLPDTPAH